MKAKNTFGWRQVASIAVLFLNTLLIATVLTQYAYAARADGLDSTPTCPIITTNPSDPNNTNAIIAQRLALYCQSKADTPGPVPGPVATQPTTTTPTTSPSTATPTSTQSSQSTTSNIAGSAAGSPGAQPSRFIAAPINNNQNGTGANQSVPNAQTQPNTEAPQAKKEPIAISQADNTTPPISALPTKQTRSYANLKKVLISSFVVVTATAAMWQMWGILRSKRTAREVDDPEGQLIDSTLESPVEIEAIDPYAHLWAPVGSSLGNRLVPPLKLISPGREEIQVEKPRTVTYLPQERPVIIMDANRPIIRSFVAPTPQRASF